MEWEVSHFKIKDEVYSDLAQRMEQSAPTTPPCPPPLSKCKIRYTLTWHNEWLNRKVSVFYEPQYTCFLMQLFTYFNDPVPTVAIGSCLWLTGVEAYLVFCGFTPSNSRFSDIFDMVKVTRISILILM